MDALKYQHIYRPGFLFAINTNQYIVNTAEEQEIVKKKSITAKKSSSESMGILPLEISFDRTPPTRDITIDLPEPPHDPAKTIAAYNCTALLKAELKKLADMNRMQKFVVQGDTLLQSEVAVIAIKHNAISCFNPTKKLSSGQTSIQLAAELLLKLPEDKRPKVITLSGGGREERTAFAKTLRAVGVTCKITTQFIDAHGKSTLVEADSNGDFAKKEQPEAIAQEQAALTARPRP